MNFCNSTDGRHRTGTHIAVHPADDGRRDTGGDNNAWKEPDGGRKGDRVIPDYGQKGNTQPFNVGNRVFKYHPYELSKAESDSPRTDWFAKHIYVIWKETGAPVPYAFRTRDGTIRSLDAGCLGHLLKRQPPEIEIAAYDEEGCIAAVRPSASLTDRCELIGVEGLRKTLGIAGTPLADAIDLAFDISAPGRCAITGTAVASALDGAHIYRITRPMGCCYGRMFTASSTSIFYPFATKGTA